MIVAFDQLVLFGMEIPIFALIPMGSPVVAFADCFPSPNGPGTMTEPAVVGSVGLVSARDSTPSAGMFVCLFLSCAFMCFERFSPYFVFVTFTRRHA